MVRNTLIQFFILTVMVTAYPVKVTRIENRFKDLFHTEVERFIYLKSEISFKINPGDKFKLYRTLPEQYQNASKKDKITICVATIEITHISSPLIRGKKIDHCDREKLPLTELKSIQIGDFIEIETALDHLEKIPQKDQYHEQASIFLSSVIMQGISPEFNTLLEEQFTLPPPKKIRKQVTPPKKQRNLKRLPRKKRKNPKKYRNFFQDVDL